MENQALVSIIIPIYNTSKYIGECIENILLFHDFFIELILVDDGSSDDSGMVCDMLAKADERIQVYHKENGGLSSARNYGVSFAKGEYIFFLDSDDCIDTSILKEFFKILQKDKPDVILEPTILNWYKDGSTSYRYMYSHKQFEAISGKRAVEQLIDGPVPLWSACSKFFRLDFWKENHFCFEKDCKTEDFDLIYRVIYNATKVYMLEKPGYYYRLNVNNSITHLVGYDFMQSLLSSIEKNKNFFALRLDESLNMRLNTLFYEMIKQYIIYNFKQLDTNQKDRILEGIKEKDILDKDSFYGRIIFIKHKKIRNALLLLCGEYKKKEIKFKQWIVSILR